MQSKETGRAGNRSPIPASEDEEQRAGRGVPRREERYRIPWLYDYVLEGTSEPEPKTDFTTAAEIVEAVLDALGYTHGSVNDDPGEEGRDGQRQEDTPEEEAPTG